MGVRLPVVVADSVGECVEVLETELLLVPLRLEVVVRESDTEPVVVLETVGVDVSLAEAVG